jgi:hypothetical protein
MEQELIELQRYAEAMIQVRVPKELKDALETVAAIKQMPISALIGEALRDYVDIELSEHERARCYVCRDQRGSKVRWLVPHGVWVYYIPSGDRDKRICFPCWKELTTKRDGRAYEAKHGRPVGLPLPGFPLEWQTGERMAPERIATHWPFDYPPKDAPDEFWYGADDPDPEDNECLYCTFEQQHADCGREVIRGRVTGKSEGATAQKNGR